ncbi:hypothetical protein [Cellulomonas sp. URHE0023]|uniref:hypothetical protein n=1 Tax=Cellulomonas sp. URHE0023 TaxID=1380354 RepID=UPI0012DD839B|nr:hypothetical protein [Cellulomonas sp. URHE0023]
MRARITLLALPTLMALTACGAGPSDPTPTPTPTAVVAPVADCMAPGVLHDLGLVPASVEDAEISPTSSSSAEPGSVPDGFVPVSVVVCTADGSLKNASGTWLALTASHREGDLAALVAALQEPSEPRGGTCSSGQAEAPALWLVDALGRALRPTWPTDRCGAPSAEVAEALAELQETDSEKYPVQQTP